MGLWRGSKLPVDRVLIGVIGEENPKRRGLYRFKGYGSGPNECFDIPDAQLLTPDANLSGAGEHRKPTEGSTCVALLGPGGACYVVGFHLPPKFDEAGGTIPTIGDAADDVGQVNNVAGDKVYRTDGGAAVILKRGGSVIIEGGDGCSTTWLKTTNSMSTVAQNINERADGYLRTRGRAKVGKTDPETIGVDEFYDQVGASAVRVRVVNGTVSSNIKRELTVSSVSYAGGKITGTIKTRERYYDDGAWVGEGQKYQFGGTGADQKAVLGNVLTDMVKDLLDIISNLKVNTAWGPSAPPVADTITKIEELKANYIDSGKILSDYLFFSKKPANPGAVNE